MKRLFLGLILMFTPILCSFTPNIRIEAPNAFVNNIEQCQIVSKTAEEIINVINVIAPHIGKKLSEEYGITLITLIISSAVLLTI